MYLIKVVPSPATWDYTQSWESHAMAVVRQVEDNEFVYEGTIPEVHQWIKKNGLQHLNCNGLWAKPLPPKWWQRVWNKFRVWIETVS